VAKIIEALPRKAQLHELALKAVGEVRPVERRTDLAGEDEAARHPPIARQLAGVTRLIEHPRAVHVLRCNAYDSELRVGDLGRDLLSPLSAAVDVLV